jgi:hypothetical protein
MEDEIVVLDVSATALDMSLLTTCRSKQARKQAEGTAATAHHKWRKHTHRVADLL